MNILNYYNLVIFIITLSISFITSAAQSPIETEYNSKLQEYNQAIISHNYDDACLTADKLLAMDPSDTFSLLRLTYCSEKLNGKYKKIIASYLNQVARSSKQEIETIELIKAINSH
ncbi:hypothetical protein [Pseudoalteromonas carrageenovora]|uniref:hypothetical protein n=1 Tax=Pseudoalteromonas carrageenovora TaxID=227 RepID=UPI0026E16DDD|nr:hypothetical protein [Pseudoalteromonas carrageenovora]MDO6466204.1 hypothetical protein [Pseudoalteromonas carrageenovora]MDO6638182.1 hypothetical protein [Pseudoalteromonas carrageenovora]MDO6650478.1 hypothetical protein [Pseudoalteromonas carrageenovora]MDO6837662.1 hypothetical protein [Pseudoalteromonas carrageenovora]